MVAPEGGSSITLHPTNGITLQAGPPASGASITLHPTNGITLQAGHWASITLHPTNGITLNVGESHHSNFEQRAMVAKCFNYTCEVQGVHSTKAMMLEENIEGLVIRTAGITEL